MSEPLLTVHNLRVLLQTDLHTVRAVNGVSFDVQQGETVGMVGESGCGKSMTCLSLLGLLPSGRKSKVEGSVLFQKKELLKLSGKHLRNIRGKEIGMIFQDPKSSLNPFLPVGIQLIEGYQVHEAIPREQAWEFGISMLERVGIPDPRRRMHAYPHELSGGMRQRILIAMALMCSPRLLIADEPTSSLDLTIQTQILELLQELQKQMKMSILLVTHDMGVIANLCRRVIVMYAGRVVECGDVESIFSRPRHPYTRGLLASIPHLSTFENGENRRQRIQAIEGYPPDLTKEIKGCPFVPRCAFAETKCLEEFPAGREDQPGHFFHCIQDVHGAKQPNL